MKRALTLGLTIVAGSTARAQQPAAPVHYYNPSWAADGKTIVFESTRDGKFAIYTIAPDGSGLRKLTSGAVNDEQPEWSRDGRRITFISDRDGHDLIYVMNRDGSGQTKVTNGTASNFVPSFSPDDKWITFTEDANNSGSGSFAIRPDGTGRRRLTDSTLDAGRVFWSRDGSWLAYTGGQFLARPGRGSTRDSIQAYLRRRDATQEVAVARQDGSGARTLTHNTVRDCCARWSADGKLLYFVSARDSASAIYAMQPDGSNVRRLTDGDAVWLDGNEGLYVRSARDGKAAIYRVGLKGDNPHRIADATTVPEVILSPDRHHLVYTRTASGVEGLYLFDIAAGTERALLTGAAAGGH